MTAYETLGVLATSTDAEIKSAFRRLALEWHPDRNKAKGAEDRFKELKAAYELVDDATKRRAYDEQLARARFAARTPPWARPPTSPASTVRTTVNVTVNGKHVRTPEDVAQTLEGAADLTDLAAGVTDLVADIFGAVAANKTRKGTDAIRDIAEQLRRSGATVRTSLDEETLQSFRDNLRRGKR